MRKRLIELQQEIKSVNEVFRCWCKDQSIPLDTRWKLLIEMQDFTETSDRTAFGLNRDDKFLYESPCYMEKYNVRDVDDILESLTDSRVFAMTPEEIITFKNYCLDNFCSKMKFDW